MVLVTALRVGAGEVEVDAGDAVVRQEFLQVLGADGGEFHIREAVPFGPLRRHDDDVRDLLDRDVVVLRVACRQFGDELTLAAADLEIDRVVVPEDGPVIEVLLLLDGGQGVGVVGDGVEQIVGDRLEPGSEIFLFPHAHGSDPVLSLFCEKYFSINHVEIQ